MAEEMKSGLALYRLVSMSSEFSRKFWLRRLCKRFLRSRLKINHLPILSTDKQLLRVLRAAIKPGPTDYKYSAVLPIPSLDALMVYSQMII